MTVDERSMLLRNWLIQAGVLTVGECVASQRIGDTIRAAIAEDRSKIDAVFPMLDILLTRMGSLTSARWDQWARYEFGDERADMLIAVLAEIRARAPKEPPTATDLIPNSSRGG